MQCLWKAASICSPPVADEVSLLAEWMATCCSIKADEASAYAQALADGGYDTVKDLAHMAEDEFPSVVKGGHRKKLIREAKVQYPSVSSNQSANAIN